MSLADGKDQSYFLCQIKKEILPKVLFPLNEFQSKEEIRTLARKYQLPVSEKKIVKKYALSQMTTIKLS